MQNCGSISLFIHHAAGSGCAHTPNAHLWLGCPPPRVVPELRIDPLHLLARCHKR